jgi:type IV secretory pathway VirB2 component (pilin)
MEKVKRFFNIETTYKFEMNDLRALIQVVNVGLIMMFGLSVSWFGLALAVFGLVKDFTTDRHLNSIVMHLAGAVLNLYFLNILYGWI